ncbi:hydroxyacylglutathione hydrolase [Colwellia sp. KU-HH00111]|uniref:hydroxyacylglutathione hydrolase n=1 Tax=Colwellia sp. KU-HH00111 TaxID=3127652 RepID=UPI003107FC94
MHSIKTTPWAVNVQSIKAFSDNYIWALTSKESQALALVDPGDADSCIAFIEKNQLVLTAILITHHHADHTGGINQLRHYCQKKQWPLTVYGPANELIPHCDVKLDESHTVHLSALNIELEVIDLPGHTAGHIAYFTRCNTQPILFCGDTLFSGGCGRLFEGTAKQMLASLTKLTHLPDDTQVYCAHEYTQANLKFALTVDPKNQALIDYNNQVNQLRANNQATIPTTIETEKQINPFLRSEELSVQASAIAFKASTKTNSLDVFTTIRSWKDQF